MEEQLVALTRQLAQEVRQSLQEQPTLHAAQRSVQIADSWLLTVQQSRSQSKPQVGFHLLDLGRAPKRRSIVEGLEEFLFNANLDEVEALARRLEGEIA